MSAPFERVSFGEISFVYVNPDPLPEEAPPTVSITNFPAIVCPDYRGCTQVENLEAVSKESQNIPEPQEQSSNSVTMETLPSSIPDLTISMTASTLASTFSDVLPPSASSIEVLQPELEISPPLAASTSHYLAKSESKPSFSLDTILKQVYLDSDISSNSPLSVLEGIDDMMAETLQQVQITFI